MALRLTGRRRRDRVLENLVLRQQLAVWERTGRRAPRVPADRQFWSLTARHWTPWRQHLQLVRPATVARWHRTVTRHPTAAWVWRQIIAATAWSHQPRYLIRDRDARFGSAFNARLHGIGIRPIVTPYRAPQANAIVKRSMGTIRRSVSTPSSCSTHGISAACCASIPRITTRCGPINRSAGSRPTARGWPLARVAGCRPARSSAACITSTAGRLRDEVLRHHSPGLAGRFTYGSAPRLAARSRICSAMSGGSSFPASR